MTKIDVWTQKTHFGRPGRYIKFKGACINDQGEAEIFLPQKKKKKEKQKKKHDEKSELQSENTACFRDYLLKAVEDDFRRSDYANRWFDAIPTFDPPIKKEELDFNNIIPSETRAIEPVFPARQFNYEYIFDRDFINKGTDWAKWVTDLPTPQQICRIFAMANENLPVPGANGEAAGMAAYQKERQKVKELANRRNALQRQLAQTEQNIFNHESEYLENTPSGNIITGFDNYTKGASSAAAQRRRTGLMEQNRVFTRSSISYNALHPENVEAASSASTPAPTPVSGSFKDKDGGSTPASTGPGGDKKTGGNGGNSKKKKKALATADDEDSDTDAREAKKVRTSFGAGGRK